MTSANPHIDAARQRVEAAYSPELLRTAGHRAIDILADHVAKVEAAQGDVLPWRHPSENICLASELLRQPKSSEPGREGLVAHFDRLVQTMLDRGHNLHHPRYIGHQVAAPVPLAGLLDAIGSITNQAMAIYDMGPWATAAEWAMVSELGKMIGWSEGAFAGLVTHGGSLANLTALLTARNVAMADSWQRGTGSPNGLPLLVVHADAHYSVARSAGILGLGTRQVVRIGLDPCRRMDPQKLDDTLADLRRQGRPIVAVSACACSTPVGAFDPLVDIAEVCRRRAVWLHVDAAHGGAACLSPRYRQLVEGLDRADSVTWDAHKMLFVPALCAFVFYRDAAHRFAAFQQDAPYLFDPAAPGLADFDSGLRSIECTKRAAVFGLWGIWSLFGPQLFSDLVDITFDLGRTFFEKLRAAPDFVPLHEPQCNIVVFRYVPDQLRDAPADVLGRFQLDLRRQIIESGKFYIVSTQIEGAGALRVTIINPLTTADHLDELIEVIRTFGQKMLRGKGE
jgi:L-2,4-diaminobutyrate decarboxylase